MKKIINNELIRALDPNYDPSIYIPDNESLTIKEWIVKYRDRIQKKDDIIYLICRDEFMTPRDLRLFAVWIAREALKLVKKTDLISINACNVAERFANGYATEQELKAAWSAASSNAWSIWASAASAASSAASSAARSTCFPSASSAAQKASFWAAGYAISYADEADDNAYYEEVFNFILNAQINQLLTYFVTV